MDGRCKTCKWWDATDVICLSTPDTWGTCTLAQIIKFSGLQNNARLVVCTDDDACLNTAPDFGCVQWEAKE